MRIVVDDVDPGGYPDPEPADKGPLRVDHIQRPPLPWRAAELTECGKPLHDRPWITRAAWIAKVRREGQQRSQLTTCITCWQTARRHPPWDENPVAALAREAQQFQYTRWSGETPRSVSFRDELLAIAALVDAHPDEFEALIAGLADAPRLADARAARRRKPRPA